MVKAIAPKLERALDEVNRGRPPIEKSDIHLRVIEDMAGRGAVLDDIAKVLGVSPSTLDRWLTDEVVKEAWAYGRAHAKDAIANRLFEIAMSGDTAACIFWLKAQAGWTDKPKAEASNAAQVIFYLPENGRDLGISST